MSKIKGNENCNNYKISHIKNTNSDNYDLIPGYLSHNKLIKSPNFYKSSIFSKNDLREIQNSVIKRPFGGSEQRFLWQKNFKNQNSHSIGVEGKPPSNLKIKNDEAPEIKKVLYCGEFGNSSHPLSNSSTAERKITRIATNVKLAENILSKRVINPTLDVKFLI
jgi:hypothetical protein